MIVAVTGGTGFIGRHLIDRLLASEVKVRVLSRYQPLKPVEGVFYHQGDLMEKESLLGFLDGVDVLYHCAGQLTNETSMRRLHVDGTANLIDVAVGNIRHWVQLSSVGVYGPVFNGVVTESSPIAPVGEYEITKAKSDELVSLAASKGWFTHSILRPSNVFGADMTNQSLFHMVNMIEKGLFFFVGTKGATANYVHVDDVVEALCLCGCHKNAIGEIFNLSDHCMIEDFVKIIASELSVCKPVLRLPKGLVRIVILLCSWIPQFPLTRTRLQALTSRSVYSTELIQQTLGYHYKVGLKNGLKSLVHGYKAHHE